MDPLETALRGLGYDVEPPQTGDPRARGIVARRDLGDRAVLLAIDAGGRFRVEITWVVEERPARTTSPAFRCGWSTPPRGR